MSNKTIKQRIALVAVSALTAGFFSVITAPAATAANVSGTSYNWGSSNATAYTSATAGFCSQDDDSDTLVVRYPSSLSSVVLYPDTDTTDIASTKYIYFAATGNGYFSTSTEAAAGTDEEVAKSADEKTITVGNNATGTALDVPESITWVPKAAGTTTINLYEVVISTGVATLLETYTLVAGAGCSAGEYSPIYSGSSLRTASSALTVSTYDDGDDSAAVSVENAAGVSYLGFWLRDALGAAVDSTTSFLNVTASGGCTISATTTDLSSTSTSVVVTSGITNKVVKLFTASAAANTCAVKASYNGTEVASKNIAFKGDLATVKSVLQDAAISDASTGAGYYDVFDSAGSRIAGVTNAAAVELTGSLIGASISFDTSTGSSTQGAYTINAVDNNRGSGTFKIRATTNAGAFIYSPAITHLVSGSKSTYSMSLDKASYSPGEIIIVTLSSKDSGGRIVPDGTTLGSSAPFLDFAIAGATALSAAPAFGDASDNGSWKYKYYAGVIEGTWAANFGLPAVVTDTAKQATYTIKSTSATVSNADVLKSIVSLIASINKQIQALQKLILARR